MEPLALEQAFMVTHSFAFLVPDGSLLVVIKNASRKHFIIETCLITITNLV